MIKRPLRNLTAASAHFADRGSRDRAALSRWQDRPVVFVGRPAGCRLRPEYDRHSGSARRAGGAATRQSPSDDVPAHADRSAQSPPPVAGTGCPALTVQLKKLASRAARMSEAISGFFAHQPIPRVAQFIIGRPVGSRGLRELPRDDDADHLLITEL